MKRPMKTLAHLGMTLMARALASGAARAADISPELASAMPAWGKTPNHAQI